VNRGPMPRVSIVIPSRNEFQTIAECLDSILASTYPAERLEILIADGRSDDGTREVIARYAASDARIRMIDNPGRIAPAGLNVALRVASGDVVVRMDAHATYPPEYIGRLVAALLESGADNVGAAVLTVPADNTVMARAIAVGLSHPLGVGNSRFRIGAKEPTWVDHVPFGCWRRTVLERLGPFDEELTRGQDVELNARILAAGGRILLLPEIVVRYHGRRTLDQLGRMMYQYGYFKPLIARKSRRLLTMRQLVPPGFLLGMVGALGLVRWTVVPFAVVTLPYVASLLGATIMAGPRRGWGCALRLLIVLPLMHAGYGAGYLHGILHHFVRPRQTVKPASAVALTR
jgi:glycosyltransferase involved in cell wall biosynthesis